MFLDFNTKSTGSIVTELPVIATCWVDTNTLPKLPSPSCSPNTIQQFLSILTVHFAVLRSRYEQYK